MKKLLYAVLLLAVFLSGCEKNPAETAPESFFLLKDGVTSEGISVGDDPASFSEAYNGYTIQVAYLDQPSSYLVMSMSKIPFQENISTIIANFFIDGKPVSENSLCKDNHVSLSELPALISSSAYLQKHDVIYRYLSFCWQNGRITQIISDELNYNETFETPRID